MRKVLTSLVVILAVFVVALAPQPANASPSVTTNVAASCTLKYRVQQLWHGVPGTEHFVKKKAEIVHLTKWERRTDKRGDLVNRVRSRGVWVYVMDDDGDNLRTLSSVRGRIRAVSMSIRMGKKKVKGTSLRVDNNDTRIKASSVKITVPSVWFHDFYPIEDRTAVEIYIPRAYFQTPGSDNLEHTAFCSSGTRP